MGRRKAGMCKCGHELRRHHDDAGVCTYGADGPFAGACARDYGGPCSKPRRKKMNGTTKQTHTVTVDGDGVLAAFDALIKAHEVGLHALRNLRAALLAGRTKTEGAAPVTRLLDDAPATSSRAEAPTRAAPSRGDGEISTGARTVLDALVTWGGTADIAEIVVATGYAARTVSDYLSELATSGHVTRKSGRAYVDTMPDDRPPKPSVDALLTRWYSQLGSGQATVLRALVAEGGEAHITTLARETDFAERTVSDYLSELARWRLLARANGIATLHPELGGPS